MAIPSFIPLPPKWQRRYNISRALLYLILLALVILFASRVFFPTLVQSFDFRSPASSKNMLLNPRSPEGTPRTNGKIEQGGTLTTDTTVVGDFSLVSITAALEKKSPVPSTLDLILRRGYQSFFYPTGEKISYFPYQESTYLINGTYYALRSGTLYPFVSEQAFLSRAPKDHAFTSFDSTLLNVYPVSEEWLGFRVGSLISNANGVFIVTSETEARPIGSANIFLALGYNFNDVIPVSEEELGIYKRGRIMILGAAHPDGTLLFDQDTDTYYLIDHGTKRQLVQPMPGYYLDFLVKDRHLHPVIISSKASERSVTCTLTPNLFRSALACDTPITDLAPGFGSDFQIQIQSPETNIDLGALSVSFETAKNRENMITLLSQIKQHFFARFGGTTP